MRSQETNAGHRRQRESGFSMVEMVTVVAIIFILASISFVGFEAVMKQQHLTNAYNTTMEAMRQARDNAVAQSTSYSVVFSNSVTPNTITVAPMVAGFSGDQSTIVYQLPLDVTFQTNAAISSTTAPDTAAGANFGTGANAIDFGYTANGSTGIETIYFCPDGSAQVAACGAGSYVGNWSNSWDDGVVYLAQGTNVLTSRAITLWGGTGRIHGWRLYNLTSTTYQWVRQ